jgi:predicted DNA-binding ribbon-helix-helix protein
MRKGSGTKVRTSLTLDKELFEEITKMCDRRTMKVSNYIEKLIRIGLKNERS